MPEQPGEFDIGPAGELQKKYGWYVENWTPPVFDPEVVPKELHDLIPLATRWGISCDVTRHDAAAKSTPEEMTDVSHLLRGRHEQICRWLYSKDGDAMSPEASAFQALLIFETEEADGPGIPGLLDWRIQEFKRSPSKQNRQQLHEAYKKVTSWPASLMKFQPLSEAKALLES